jgi:hypothetical protein
MRHNLLAKFVRAIILSAGFFFSYTSIPLFATAAAVKVDKRSLSLLTYESPMISDLEERNARTAMHRDSAMRKGGHTS